MVALYFKAFPEEAEDYIRKIKEEENFSRSFLIELKNMCVIYQNQNFKN